MRVVDPQSALITNIEVYDFLKSHNPRKSDKKIGAYEPIDLRGYKEVRQDVMTYIGAATPQLVSGPSPDQYMKNAVKDLRAYGLTKSEVATIINLAIGMPRPPPSGDDDEELARGVNEGVNGETNDESEADIAADHDDTSGSVKAESSFDPGETTETGTEVLNLIIENIEERFPEEVREQKMLEILRVLRHAIAAIQPPIEDKRT